MSDTRLLIWSNNWTCYIHLSCIHTVLRYISSRLSWNSEANASECLEKSLECLEKMENLFSCYILVDESIFEAFASNS